MVSILPNNNIVSCWSEWNTQKIKIERRNYSEDILVAIFFVFIFHLFLKVVVCVVCVWFRVHLKAWIIKIELYFVSFFLRLWYVLASTCLCQWNVSDSAKVYVGKMYNLPLSKSCKWQWNRWSTHNINVNWMGQVMNGRCVSVTWMIAIFFLRMVRWGAVE